LRATVAREVSSLGAFLGEVRSTLPPSGPVFLTEVLQHIATRLDDVVGHCLAKSPNDTATEEVLSKILEAIRTIHEKYLKYLTVNPALSAAPEMLLTMRSMASRFFGVDGRGITFAPSIDNNYGIDPFYDLVGGYDGAIAGMYRKLGIVCPEPTGFRDRYPLWLVQIPLPFAERRNALAYSLLMHEFAHIWDAQGSISNRLHTEVWLLHGEDADVETAKSSALIALSPIGTLPKTALAWLGDLLTAMEQKRARAGVHELTSSATMEYALMMLVLHLIYLVSVKNPCNTAHRSGL